MAESGETMRRLLGSDLGLAGLALRLVCGAVFFGHGAQKLFGWFDGAGLEQTGAWFAALGLVPGPLLAGLAGSVELAGGVLLALGLLTRPVAAILGLLLIVAISVAHVGMFGGQGAEFALTLGVCCLTLALRGAGSYSCDALIAGGGT